jgi:hypothetical protein
LKSKEFIISGGVKPLSAYYLQQRLKVPALIGMAFSFLKYAREDYRHLQSYIKIVEKSLQIAHTFLQVK